MECFLHVEQLHRFAFGELLDGHPGPGGDDMGNVLLRYHRGALFWGLGGLDLTEDRFDTAFGSGSLRSQGLIIAPGLKNATDLVAKFNLFVA